MIREAVSQALTDVANSVLPEAVADKWRTEHFVVFFRPLKLISPSYHSDDGLWEAVVGLGGEFSVRLQTDEKAPLDPTLLVIALRENPLVILPDPDATAAGQYGLQIVWKPDEVQDVMLDHQVVPEIRGVIENSYILRRTEYELIPIPAEIENVTEL